MARAAEPVTAQDRELARRALDKQQRGGTPTVREAAAMRKAQRARDAADRDRLCRELPQHVYLALAGITAPTAHRHAADFGLPCRGRTIDLAAVLAAVHTLLETHGHRLTAPPDGGPLDRYRAIKADREEIKLNLDRNQFLPQAEVHAAFARIAGLFRGAVERLQRDHPEAAEIVNETLEDAEKLDPTLLTPADDASR